MCFSCLALDNKLLVCLICNAFGMKLKMYSPQGSNNLPVVCGKVHFWIPFPLKEPAPYFNDSENLYSRRWWWWQFHKRQEIS
jgi:hypothetical protein